MLQSYISGHKIRDFSCKFAQKGRIFRTDDSLAAILGYNSTSLLFGTEIHRLIPGLSIGVEWSGVKQMVCGTTVKHNGIPFSEEMIMTGKCKNSALKDVGNTRPSYDPALDQQGLVYEFEKRGPQSRYSGGSRTGQFKRWSTSSNATAKANSSKNYSMQSTRPSYGSTIAGGNATALANNSRNYSMQSARPSYGSTIAGGNATALANNSRNYSMQSARPSTGSTNAAGNQSSKNNQKDNAEDDRDSFYDDDEDLFKDLI
ncbi:hypothetical protein Ddc_03042 [Ditylenchus destructor]|nr:hypothetical protein Ddc_03042 [Ditylenchus destructor]